jgi:hypothetical protein
LSDRLELHFPADPVQGWFKPAVLPAVSLESLPLPGDYFNEKQFAAGFGEHRAQRVQP